ncbi:MAG: glycosyltransferase family 2 protein [Thermoleophilaceae bacterium]
MGVPREHDPTPLREATTAALAGEARLPEPASPLVSALVPAYNEAETVEEVVRQLAALPLRTEIVVVNDGSVDGTAEALERLDRLHIPRLQVIHHDRNRGKSAAIRTALAASRGDVVVIQDADLEYDPAELPRLLKPILDGRADVVYGTRLRGGGEPQRAHLFWHYAGNRFLSLLTDVLYNTTISDMEVGYKAFRGELIRSIELVSDGFGFEPEVTAKLLRRGEVRLYELPIAYYGRTYTEGKKITWRDGLTALTLLVRYRFGPVGGKGGPPAGSGSAPRAVAAAPRVAARLARAARTRPARPSRARPRGGGP